MLWKSRIAGTFHSLFCRVFSLCLQLIVLPWLFWNKSNISPSSRSVCTELLLGVRPSAYVRNARKSSDINFNSYRLGQKSRRVNHEIDWRLVRQQNHGIEVNQRRSSTHLITLHIEYLLEVCVHLRKTNFVPFIKVLLTLNYWDFSVVPWDIHFSVNKLSVP